MILAAAASALSLVALKPAFADPKSEMCELVKVLAEEGVSAAIAFMEKATPTWTDEQRTALATGVGAWLLKYEDFRGGQVYQVAHLPGVIEEYLLTLNLKGGGSVYLRVLYEGNGGDVALINFRYRADYYEAIETAFLQPPAPVSCPAN
jgi:hypothetical protein